MSQPNTINIGVNFSRLDHEDGRRKFLAEARRSLTQHVQPNANVYFCCPQSICPVGASVEYFSESGIEIWSTRLQICQEKVDPEAILYGPDGSFVAALVQHCILLVRSDAEWEWPDVRPIRRTSYLSVLYISAS